MYLLLLVDKVKIGILCIHIIQFPKYLKQMMLILLKIVLSNHLYQMIINVTKN